MSDVRRLDVGRHVTYYDLAPRQRQALDEALIVLENSYNPYSGFSVGATLIPAKVDELITGTNFENAAHGSTICAERAAVLRANSMGLRRFEGIAIVGRHKGGEPTTEVTAPCGSCRQVLWELADLWDSPLDVILSTTTKDRIILTSISELLPRPFGPADMKNGLDIISQFRK